MAKLQRLAWMALMARAKFGASELAKTFAASSQPVYLLNSRRLLIYMNPAAAAWLGQNADQLLGARCDYHSQSVAADSLSLAAGLCPPPEAFASSHYRGVVSAPSPNGELRERSVDFVALPLHEANEPALLAIVAEEDAKRDPAPPAADEPSAAELHVLLRWLRQTLGSRGALERWVGESADVRRVREQFQIAVAAQSSRAIIIGPPGSGAADFAKSIHYARAAADDRALVPVPCALVDAEQLQAAVLSLARQKSPRSSSGATLLLLEADRLSPSAQQELAGFLQLPHFEATCLATAERSLLALAERGEYHRELAFALSTLVIELPALAARRADLPLLVQALVEENNALGGKQLSGCAPEALDRLDAYAWPGDMDQLAAAVRESFNKALGPYILPADLPGWLHHAEQAAAYPRPGDERIVLDEFLADIERELLARALQRARGNKARAAKLLGISRPRLLRRLDQLGLAPIAKKE